VIRTSEGTLLRIFIGDSDRHEGRPLSRVLVDRARARGLSGATVLHGPMGFGRHSQVHNAGLADLQGDLPVVVELVGSLEAIQAFMADVDALVPEGLVTLETVRIVSYEKPAGA